MLMTPERTISDYYWHSRLIVQTKNTASFNIKLEFILHHKIMNVKLLILAVLSSFLVGAMAWQLEFEETGNTQKLHNIVIQMFRKTN